MPALNITSELGADVEDFIVVVVVMDCSSYAVSEHAFLEWRKFCVRMLLQEGGGGRRIPFRSGIRVCWSSEVVEFVLS